MNSQHKTKSAVIDQIVEFAKQHSSANQSSVFYDFIKAFFRNLSCEDLSGYQVSNLYGIANSIWHAMSLREPGQICLRVYNPDVEKDGWSSTHTVIELVTDDMPFLVDSMSMELTRLGVTIHQMIYSGGIKCIHDDGQLTALVGYEDEVASASLEAPIIMEIDRQNNAESLQSVQDNLNRVIHDVKRVVSDWALMKKTVEAIVSEYSNRELQQRFPDMEESCAFLSWMLNDCFTFLGLREYELVGTGDDRALQIVSGTGLGVLHDEKRGKQKRQYADLPEEARRVALSREQCLIITKTNTRSTVHRPAYTDYVGVKKFDQQGNLVGEYRIVGLYTSVAYSSNPVQIPFLRQKVNQVMTMSKLPVRSHAGKDLMHILATFPRDDLLHASSEEIYHLAVGIMRLQERRRIRMFARKDIYGRFISIMVYLPRDNFNTALVERMRHILAEETDALEVMLNTRFSESVLARLHFIVRIDSKKPRGYDFKAIENRLVAVGQSWEDGLLQNLLSFHDEAHCNELMGVYRTAFPISYREEFMARDAVRDIESIERIRSGDAPVAFQLYRSSDCGEKQVRLKLLHPFSTVPLSDAVPILENLGFRVLSETPYRIKLSGNSIYWINDFSLESMITDIIDIDSIAPVFYDAMLKLWQRELENDAFNRLILASRFNWRQVSLLRAYAKYLRQTAFGLSQQYIEQTLVRYHSITSLIWELFSSRFDPDSDLEREQQAKRIIADIHSKLDEVTSLDQDRILRMYISVIRATLRTNFYQLNDDYQSKSYIALKIDSTAVPEMPLPLPAYEAFIYSPRFEGIHLRSSSVARGGIRWSDRKEDFRVEVLGLMKAQQVKNALIVPSGAKGGFVTKRTTSSMDREEFLAEGISCYQDFIRGLLDLTDNLLDESVVYAPRTLRYDGDDTYFVVAADKGTATFSDIANEISLKRNYWLGDAFASGGSAGYDHKKMGITAKGAWVSAQRHFLDLGVNADTDAITVVGIGDLAGDVFGNGVLMSANMKLVAAFNHMHIFLDPNPDPQKSYNERKRMFSLPRSTWDDYDRTVVSKGGGVYKRSAKSIRLTAEVKQLLGIEKDVIVPNELIIAIVKAKVDLIWNGGIGTFVKGKVEKNGDVGDRFNDHIRVDGCDLRARVLCEGGNLGVTQLGRIDYELAGGRVNTDFIDNSAGVDCSDHEVNIKILLNAMVKKGSFNEEERNKLLEKMTENVSSLVLKNNYLQNQSVSLLSLFSDEEMPLYIRYLEYLEAKGLINREIEFLPTSKELLQRKVDGRGLTRPELSVLFAYTKNILKDAILASTLPEDPVIEQMVMNIFPDVLIERFSDDIRHHRLKREIIATQLSSQFVSDAGIIFYYQMQDEVGADIEDIIRAYVCAKEVFDINSAHGMIDALDHKVSADLQYRMMLDGVNLVRRSMRWLLCCYHKIHNIEQTIDQFADRIRSLYARLPKLLTGKHQSLYEQDKQHLIAANVPEEIAMRMASATPLYNALNIVEVANVSGSDLVKVAKIYFMLVDKLELLSIRDYINAYSIDSRWTVMVRTSFNTELDAIQRELTNKLIKYESSSTRAAERIDEWLTDRVEQFERVQRITGDLRRSEVPDFAIMSVVLRELKVLASDNRRILEINS